MNSPISSLMVETIARTIGELSLIFTGLPPRLSPLAKQEHYRTMSAGNLPTGFSNAYPPLPPQTAHYFQYYEWENKSPPHHLREGKPAAESTTPSHVHYDSDRSTTSPDSFSEPRTPSSSSTESESETEYFLPYIDTPTTTPEPDIMIMHRPPFTKHHQLPKDYTKLPHFHPPRFSRRLRGLIAERRRPAKLHLVPVVQTSTRDEAKTRAANSHWVVTSPDVEAGRVESRRSLNRMRVLLLAIFAALFGGAIALALVLTLGRTR